jgi:hypothetical protein
MNGLQRFEKLVRRARQEPVPTLDVAGSVMRRLADHVRPATPDESVFAICGAVSALAAVVAVAITVWAWSTWTDPLAQIFTQTFTVMQ